MFASFHAAPEARIGGCLLENRGERELERDRQIERERGRKRERERAKEGGRERERGRNARCQPPGE